MVRQDRLRWFGHVEQKSGDDCRPVELWWWQGLDVRVEGGRLGMNV